MIQFTHSKKKIDPNNKTMFVQLDFKGEVKTPVDAMTLFADWFCREVRAMGYDPTKIIEQIDGLAQGGVDA